MKNKHTNNIKLGETAVVVGVAATQRGFFAVYCVETLRILDEYVLDYSVIPTSK